MTNQDKSNHWEELATHLGAAPPPQQEETRPAEDARRDEQEDNGTDAVVQDIPAIPPAVSTGPEPKAERAATDWSRLAAELGIQPQEEIAEVPPSGQEATAEPDFDSVSREIDWLEPDDDPDEAEPDVPEEEPAVSARESVEAPGEPAERKPGQHRRPRRRKSHKPADEAPEGDIELRSDVESSIQTDEPSTVEVDPRPEKADEEPAPERAKRRRRRRSTSRKKNGANKDGGRTESEVEEEPAVMADKLDDTPEGPEESTDSRDSQEKGKKTAKGKHRAIPSWEEAAGIIISANMESRAKNPDSRSFSHSRGGRKRGGRKKSAEKPS